MAVKSIGNTGTKFQGFSTDEKPLSVRDGSTFHDIDTGTQWIFHDGMWEIDFRLVEHLRPI